MITTINSMGESHDISVDNQSDVIILPSVLLEWRVNDSTFMLFCLSHVIL